jgi:aerobic carbon-monoxide dehydrogenase small subunit
MDDRRKVTLRVNGKRYTREAEPRTLLVYLLRDSLHLTGTHVGCDTGHCGACTVIINGVSVKSCMVLAVAANGADILTVEGLADGDNLHPLQESFWENHGLQCGYCTPGMLMSAYFLLKRNPNPTNEEIAKALEGNLCMCTGYENILRSIRAAAEKMRGVSQVVEV